MFEKAKERRDNLVNKYKDVKATPQKLRNKRDEFQERAAERRAKVEKTIKDVDSLARKLTKRDEKGYLEIIKVALEALKIMEDYRAGKIKARPRFDRRVKGCRVKLSGAGWVIVDACNKLNFDILLAAFCSEVPEAKQSRFQRKPKPSDSTEIAEQPMFGLAPGHSPLEANGLQLIKWEGGRYTFYLVHTGENPRVNGPRWTDMA